MTGGKPRPNEMNVYTMVEYLLYIKNEWKTFKMFKCWKEHFNKLTFVERLKIGYV